jgi:hypothetical protein
MLFVGLPGMFKNLFHSSPGGDSAKHSPELAPHRAEVEFALVLVEPRPGSDRRFALRRAAPGNTEQKAVRIITDELTRLK